MSRVFDFMLLKIGIKRELSCAHTPLQNGVSERKNRHLVESCRAGPCYRPREFRIFLGANALGLQPFCITKPRLRQFPTRGYMICYTRRYQTLGTHLRLFGCVCYVHLPEPSKGKLDKKAVKCVFVGSSTERKGWRYMEPSTRRVYESRDVVFDEGTRWGGFAAERGDVNKPATTVFSKRRKENSNVLIELTPLETRTSPKKVVAE